jgi:hypothetical protein
MANYSTLQHTFPTPLIFPQIGGIICISAEVTTVQTGSVDSGERLTQ